MAEIFQDKTSIIGTITKIEPVRVSRTGYPSIYFVVSIPSPKCKNPIYIPCKIFGKEADELEKKRLSMEINVNDTVEISGSHLNTLKNGAWHLEVKAKSVEKHKQETNLFGGEK